MFSSSYFGLNIKVFFEFLQIKMSASFVHLDWQNKRKLSQRSSPKSSLLKLPYLKPQKPMVYHNEEEQVSKRENFNLLTNNIKMPHYDPTSDKNLAYFFDKPSNRKLIEDLKEAERRKSQSRSSKTDRDRSELYMSSNGSGEVSKAQFQNYLNKMKARVVSGATKK